MENQGRVGITLPHLLPSVAQANNMPLEKLLRYEANTKSLEPVFLHLFSQHWDVRSLPFNSTEKDKLTKSIVDLCLKINDQDMQRRFVNWMSKCLRIKHGKSKDVTIRILRHPIITSARDKRLTPVEQERAEKKKERKKLKALRISGHCIVPYLLKKFDLRENLSAIVLEYRTSTWSSFYPSIEAMNEDLLQYMQGKYTEEDIAYVKEKRSKGGVSRSGRKPNQSSSKLPQTSSDSVMGDSSSSHSSQYTSSHSSDAFDAHRTSPQRSQVHDEQPPIYSPYPNSNEVYMPAQSYGDLTYHPNMGNQIPQTYSYPFHEESHFIPPPQSHQGNPYQSLPSAQNFANMPPYLGTQSNAHSTGGSISHDQNSHQASSQVQDDDWSDFDHYNVPDGFATDFDPFSTGNS